MLFVIFIVLAAAPLPAQLAAASKAVPKPEKAASAAPSRPRMGAAAQRNENVAIQQIDNNAIKEANIRVGTRTTIIPAAPADASYFAAEHGRPASELLLPPGVIRYPGWHAELFGSHQNSVFNARTFFQAGPVLPSRKNQYGFRATVDAGPFGFITATGTQRKTRGMVNGNVLVPLAHERTPLAADPAVRAVVSRFLAAYPASLPNRPDFDPRALNTNAPQRIDGIDGSLRLDRDTGSSGKLTIAHALTRARTDAFQLVAGQNPDTDIHSHQGRIAWTRSLSPATNISLAFAFHRVRSLLLPEPNAVGPRVRFGFQIEELGPDSHFPVNRAQNTFRYGGIVSKQAGGGTHVLTFGADLIRFQLNGIETNNQRGYFQFTNNFGRSSIENLRLGTPSTYEVALGELHRGYRNWSGHLYAADQWRAHPRLQVYYGLRYSVETAPVEVQKLDVIPYSCDCNNFSPRLSFAWQAGGGWVVRSGGFVSFSQIPPVTYQQVRNNLPLVRFIQVQNPDLLNPLSRADLNSTSPRTSPTILSPDLVSPYAYQYNFSAEKRILGGYVLRTGYVGSRTYKLLNSFIFNRAVPVPGIPLITATVDRRRPDSRFYEVRHVVNGGIAYFDAVQASIEMPMRRGLVASATYTFGKAIDEGPDFSSTAANRDMLSGRSQSQYESFADRRGLSNFDSPHAVQMNYSYDLPAARGTHRALQAILSGWQLSGAALWKVGTPLTLYIGSDAPGFGNVDGGPSDRPNIVDSSILGSTIAHPNIAPIILARDRFAYITPGDHRGSLGRGTFRKAGIANLNAAITKQWRFSGRREWTALFRVEAYNLSNTPQFDEPQRNFSAPSFGKITNTLNDGRVFQLGLRFLL